jgi:hypothetical protein
VGILHTHLSLTWLGDSASPLTLDDASAAYLRQASFDLGQTRLSHEDLAGLHRLLTAPATVRRKAA